MSSASSRRVLPGREILSASRAKLLRKLPENGIGLDATVQHLHTDIVPGLSLSSQSPNYYGFVTGGATPAASAADHLAVDFDQNVAVHLPNDSIATNVEDAALLMMLDLTALEAEQFRHRIFTTGATGSNVLGLACGREYVIRESARRHGKDASVAEDGIFDAMKLAGLERIQILSTYPHSSLRKSAAIVGLGRNCFVEVGRKDDDLKFDLGELESKLRAERTASIVSVSCAEINTGLFATSLPEVKAIRDLCDKYGAWLHIDAAFGLQARCLARENAAYTTIVEGVAGLELADSITGDAHKLLNGPYDCGIFFSRHLDIGTQVFQNPGAAYLRTTNDDVPSPLNIGLENSRRFRALPVYATLSAYGLQGYRDMLLRQIDLARAIAGWIHGHPEYELLPHSDGASLAEVRSRTYMVVLFRSKGDLNKDLTQRINATRKIYVSGTQWQGEAATRFAVSNWQVDIDRDIALIASVLEDVLE